MSASSALDAAGAVAAGQLLYLGHGDHIVVALDGVLQSRRRHGELHRRLSALPRQQGVDQAAAEAVAAAYPVDDVQLVFLGEALYPGHPGEHRQRKRRGSQGIFRAGVPADLREDGM